MSNPRPLDILLVGDSLMEYWSNDAPDSWQAEFGSRKVVNLGRAGDTTSDALTRLQEAKLELLAPKVTIVLIGTNDISFNDGSPVEIAERAAGIVDLIIEKIPKTKVLWLGVLPRDYSPLASVRETVRQVNAELALQAKKRKVRYLDIGDKFIDKDGFIPSSLMYDGIHLSDEAYAIWAENMRDTLDEMLAAATASKK